MPPADPRTASGGAPTGRPGATVLGRRTLLAAGLLAPAALAGCGLLDGGDAAPGAPAARPGDPAGTADLAAVLRAEESLLAAYRESAERHPGLRERLDGLRRDHEEHRRVLRALLTDLDPAGPWAAGPAPPPPAPSAVPAAPAPAATAPASGSPPAVPARPEPAGGSPRVPAEPERALAALRVLEQEAASARTEQAVRADARWAPLLAVLAASESAHAAVLAA